MSGLSPFHKGEQMVQERMGVRQSSESLGRRMVRDFMPDQHRELYAQLPLLFVASLDQEGRPWASVLASEPGFVGSEDARHLNIGVAPPAYDPGDFSPDSQVGILALEFETRRRNRMNGTVTESGPHGFTVGVEQSFGNCPQYIQTRRRKPASGGAARLVSDLPALDLAGRALVEGADTFFIASVYEEQGLDMSHRGGKPGFVKVLNERALVWPDYSGNNHFNTIGNLAMDSRSGYLFPDFARGVLLYLTGHTEIQWEGAEVESFVGAQRLLVFHLERAVLVENSLPFRWDLEHYSPSLVRTGTWKPEVRQYEVIKKVIESEQITSFHLRCLEGGRPPFRAGQHLSLKLGEKGLLTRTYSLSGDPEGEYLRISVKREPRGMGSRFLHDRIQMGDTLEAHPPSGDFVLKEGRGPVALLAAGVGITPLLAMAYSLVEQGRPVTLVQSARHGGQLAFREELLALQGKGLKVHTIFTQPRSEDILGRDFDSQGRLGGELLKQLSLGQSDIYMCGPPSFLEGTHAKLLELGIDQAQVSFEAFGRSPKLESGEPAEVRFSVSEVAVQWSGGTLLELAEEAGLKPSFSCRSGSCGACLVKLASGAVEYKSKPLFSHGPGEGLLCSARPAGQGEALVIEL